MTDLDPRSLNPEGAMKDGSLELFDMVRARIVAPGGLYFLGKGVIGFPDLRPRSHLAVTLFYEDDSIQSKLVEFPKSHLKSTLGTITKTLHIFAKRAILGQDLIDRVALSSNTKTNSKRFLRLVKLIPESNIVFQNFLPELLPEFSNEEVWNQDEIVFPRVGSFTDPSVDTLGVGGAATSRHYTFIIEDDMLAEEDCDSPTAIRKAIELHQYYTSLLVPTSDGKMNFVTNEHAWTQFDLNKHIIDKEPETAVFSVGATRGMNYERSRLVPENIMKLARAWDDGEGVWPERYGKEELARRRAKAGARTFNAVFENDPFDPDVVDFKEEWLNYFEWGTEHQTGEKYIRIMPRSRPGGRQVAMEKVRLTSLNVVSAFDPALSKKTTAARSAHIITGVDPIGRVFIMSTWAKRVDPLVAIDNVFAQCHEWGVNRCAIEAVLFQKVLADLLQERCKVWNRDHPSDKMYSGMFEEVKPAKGKGKEGRIRALIGTSFEEGRIYIHSSMTDFIDEYLHFPIGATVDLLDAFAYVSELWSYGVEEDEIEAFLEREQEELDNRNPITGY